LLGLQRYVKTSRRGSVATEHRDRVKNGWLTFDFQRVRNPAYNADRGPVTVESLRLQIEF